MKRLRLLAVATGLLILAAAAVAGTSLARPADTPFYLVPAPPPTNECHNVKLHCVSVIGPWVSVPASGEATFLLSCPKRKGFVGGSDSQASSSNVHIWFDGQIGAPIGQSITTGPFLLFHAVTDNGKPGSFAPILGCVTPKQQASSRATVSARRTAGAPGTNPGASLEPRAKVVVLVAGSKQSATKSCLRREKVVGSWSALAFATPAPPDLSHTGLVTIKTAIVGNSVIATIQTDISLPFTPLAEVQIGAMCAP